MRARRPSITAKLRRCEAYQITVKGQAAGLPFAAIQAMGGGASFYTLAVNPAGQAATDITYVDGALFVQDDWKIRRTSR